MNPPSAVFVMRCAPPVRMKTNVKSGLLLSVRKKKKVERSPRFTQFFYLVQSSAWRRKGRYTRGIPTCENRLRAELGQEQETRRKQRQSRREAGRRPTQERGSNRYRC